MRNLFVVSLALCASALSVCTALAAEPINIGFLWHMHQPIYIPGETITQTDANGHFSFSVTDVHNQRFGPYTSWPKNAIDAGLNMAHLGAQVSFSGSLMENLNNLEEAGTNGGMWNNWENSYRTAANYDTALGNPRLDLVGFGYHHPLMPLLDERDMRMQIKLHKLAHQQTWGPNVPYSKGIFPAETAFSTRMIPALVAEGMEWAIVDNIHFDRATQNYPHTNASNLYAPNRADQINPDPAANGGAWIQLNNLWAPSQVSAPFSYTPSNVQHVDPQTGEITKIVAVPAARYEGNEDGRGGFGALQYEQVMSQYLQYNTNPDRPMFVLLHHDGDNFGGGSEAYYHGNFQNMVNWASANQNYDVTTVQDYLDRFPVPENDVIHVASGSWAGADNGDPEFKKWLGDSGPDGWSPDRNSWAVLTAAKNRVYTADDIAPYASLNNIQAGNGAPTERAWHYLLQAQASDHWYWDGTEVWDSNVTRGSNLAAAQADLVINNFSGQETTSPTVFLPQRESYNPGGFEFGSTPEPSDFEVWTYAYDVSGLTNVTLKYRIDNDGFNPLTSTDNETYSGGDEVGDWASIVMQSSDVAPPAGILPATYRAQRYAADIAGHEDVLIDYYVEAIDALGNVTRSDIQHVYVGSATTGGGPGSGVGGVSLSPDPAVAGQLAALVYDPAGAVLSSSQQVHAYYGFNDWTSGITQTAMQWDEVNEVWTLDVPIAETANLFDVVFNDGGSTWDNNSGQDWQFAVEGGSPGFEFVMDGQLDAGAQLLATGGSQQLYAFVEGNKLYVATNDAGEGYDVFIYLADEPGELTPANWAKSGQVAGWDAFLADENDNGFNGWFDQAGETQSATGDNGGMLEGVIDLLAEFGEMPEDIYLAVALFDSADGGTLQASFQVSSGNGDGNIDAAEFVQLLLQQTLPGDFNADGVVDLADYTVWRDNLGSTMQLPGEQSTPGVVTAEDFEDWKANYGTQLTLQGGADSEQAVPEPSTLGLLLLIGLAGLCKCCDLKVPLLRSAKLGFAVALLCSFASNNAHAQQTSPAPILQWFEASWDTIEHRTPDLFTAGYGSLWTPPPGRSVYLPQGGGIGYDPYDRFDLGSPRDETLYGTEAMYLSAIRETQKFGGNVYVDYVHHHLGSFDLNLNGYTYPQALINQGAPYLQDRADYPGFELSDPNNSVTSPFHRDTYADLYGANAGQTPFGDVFEYWFRLGENLVTIDLASNRSFVRHPVPGEAQNIRQAPTAWAIPTTTVLPNGLVGASTIVRQANVPTEANRRFYPDQDGPSRTVVDNGETYTVYDFNLSDPSLGDPVAETPRAYMMRYAQWLTQVVGVDGLRVDAARHVPLGVFNSAYNPESLDIPQLVDRAVAGASSRYNLDGTQREVFQFQEVFDYNASTLASFVRKSQPAGDTVNPDRDVLDFSMWAAMAQNMSSNGLQNNWFNIRSSSVNATINGTSDPNIANNGENGIGFVYNHDEGVSPPGLGDSIVLDNVAHAWVLMRPGNAYVFYRSDEFDRSDNSLFFLKQGRGDALGGTFGNIVTDLVDLRNSYGRGDFIERFIDNAFSPPQDQQSAIYVFEREGSALVGLNVGYNPGATSRTVNTTFTPGQWLEEVTGNWQDPSGEVRQYTVVDGAGQTEVDIPWNNAGNGNKGYAIYGLPRPRGTLTVSNVSQVLDETPTAATNGTARIADVSVITTDSFDVTLATDAVLLNGGSLGTYRDLHADGDRALLRIDEGFDANGNGVADYPSSASANTTRYGFEEFTTINSPGFGSATGDGLYRQTVDATQLSEGYHYLTTRAWRAPRPGESEVYTDFREVIYIDRFAPESAFVSADQFGGTDSTRDFRFRSTDGTANNVHVLLNLPASLDDSQILSLLDSSNQAEQIDRDLFGLIESSVIDGNHVATVVTYEITGNFSIQRFTGIRQATSLGLGFGDLDADNVFEVGDIQAFESIFLSDNSQFSPAADLTGDGLVELDDLFTLEAALVMGGADAATLAAYDLLISSYLLPGDYNLDGAVTQDDFASWRQQFGAGGFASADGNRDGVVNLADYTIWRNNLGAALPGVVAAQTNVPEPSAAMLAMFTMAVCAAMRCRALPMFSIHYKSRSES